MRSEELGSRSLASRTAGIIRILKRVLGTSTLLAIEKHDRPWTHDLNRREHTYVFTYHGDSHHLCLVEVCIVVDGGACVHLSRLCTIRGVKIDKSL